MSKTKYTGRKFYNKWLYKVTLSMPGSSIFRKFSALDEVISFCNNLTVENTPYRHQRSAFVNRENIIKLCTFLVENKDIDFSKRIETDMLDVYTNDQNFFNLISKTFEELVIHTFEPIPGQEQAMLNTSGIVTTKLPHNKYYYKVYLLPHKMKGDKESKEKFVTWVSGQSKIRISEAVKKWFIKTDWNWDRRYILIEDEQTLFMLKLRSSDVVGRVYNYQLVDK